MTKKVKLILIPPVVILVLGIFGFAGKAKDVKKIKANPKQTVATIVAFDNLNEYNTNGCWIDYQYTVDGITYKHSKKIPRLEKRR